MAKSTSNNNVSAETERQMTLEKKGNVFVITFTGSPNNKANVFNIPLVKRLDNLLDQVLEKKAGRPCALILTGYGKFFSAGFDLKALTGKSLAEQKNPSRSNSRHGPNPQGQELVQLSWKVLSRLLIFPVPTIALFNGHAFGLGFFIGMACDHRMMIEKNQTPSFLCLPEVNIGLPLGEGFAALAKCKLPMNALRDSALTGRRWTCQEAKAHGIIDAIVAEPSSNNIDDAALSWIPPKAVDIAEKLISTSEKGNLSKIKLELYGDTHSVLNRSKSRL